MGQEHNDPDDYVHTHSVIAPLHFLAKTEYSQRQYLLDHPLRGMDIQRHKIAGIVSVAGLEPVMKDGAPSLKVVDTLDKAVSCWVTFRVCPRFWDLAPDGKVFLGAKRVFTPPANMEECDRQPLCVTKELPVAPPDAIVVYWNPATDMLHYYRCPTTATKDSSTPKEDTAPAEETEREGLHSLVRAMSIADSSLRTIFLAENVVSSRIGTWFKNYTDVLPDLDKMNNILLKEDVEFKWMMDYVFLLLLVELNLSKGVSSEPDVAPDHWHVVRTNRNSIWTDPPSVTRKKMAEHMTTLSMLKDGESVFRHMLMHGFEASAATADAVIALIRRDLVDAA